MSDGFKARVFVAKDEKLALNLLRKLLTSADFQVEALTSLV
jgi:hypothetical protein